MNSFVIPHVLMRGQIGTYAYMQTSTYSQFHDGRTVKQCPNKHTQISKIKTDEKKQEKNCFILKMHYVCNNLLDQSKKRLINYYQYNCKRGKNLLGRGVGETIVGTFLLTPWLIGIKYSRYITLCDTNTVISNITNNSNCN